MLPAAPNANGAGAGLPGGGVLNANAPPFVGVEVSAGVSLSEPNASPPPKMLPAAGFSASFSVSSFSFAMSCAAAAKRLLEKMDGAAAVELSAGLFDAKVKVVEDDEDGAPNAKED